MSDETLRELYTQRRTKYLLSVAQALENHLRGLVSSLSHIDQVSVRAKGIESFLRKAEKKTDGGEQKYSDPMHQIQDQIGARITAFYLNDIPLVKEVVEKYFGAIESKLASPESPREFDYEGQHYILFIPDDVVPDELDDDSDIPKFFELQIKTLFQHAWSQAEHDLAYKPETVLSRDQRRLVAFTAAQAWGADLIFSKLAVELGTK